MTSFMYSRNLVYLLILIFVFQNCKQAEYKKLFSKVHSSESKIRFKNLLEDSKDFNVLKYGYFYNGGGVAAADFNNDGYLDLYFTANIGDDKLYINKGSGKISFEDITATAGIKIEQGWKTGVSVVDINEDGWMDIYICRSAAESPLMRSNLLFINNKNLTFTESAAKYGLNDSGYSTQAAFFDYDKDGDLDCFILNHSVQKYAGFSQNLKRYKATQDINYTSRLLQNDDGKYVDVTNKAGLISNVLSFGLGVMVSDYNNDGWLDLYVSNDYNEEDYLYINQQDGTFIESIKNATTYTSLFSMGSDAADINDDGTIDLMTLDMLPEKNERIKMTSGDDNYEKYQNLLNSGFHHQYMRNMLQINIGNHQMYKTNKGIYVPQFKEVAQFSGVSNTDWSWSALIADFDNDGSKDIFVTNGYEKDYTNMDFLSYTVDLQTKNSSGKINEMDVISNMPTIKESNYIFKNEGGLRFSNQKLAWGIDEITNSAGAVYADLDNDGDLDLITNNLNAEASIYKNNTLSKNNNFVKVALKNANQSHVIGAKVYVYHASGLKIQEFIPVRGYQSSSQQPLVFGLGNVTKLDSLRVDWTDGTSDILFSPGINRTIEMKKGIKNLSYPPIVYPINLTEVSNLDFAHLPNEINDFKIQSLLPYAVSGQGPKLVSNQSKDLLYICGTQKSPGKIFKYSKGSFVPIKFKNVMDENVTESSATFADIDSDGDDDLIVVHFGYDIKPKSTALLPKVFINHDNKFELQNAYFGSEAKINAGVVLAFDYDNDGDQDIFIGCRVMPSQYPQSMPSILFTNDGKGNFTINNGHTLDLGMVTDALTLVNPKGFLELIVAREFNSVIKVLNANGLLNLSISIPITDTGLWFSLASGDLNKDGVMDIVAGNLGLNNQLNFVSKGQLSLYDFPFFGIAKSIPLLCINEEGNTYPFAARDELLSQIPQLKKKYTNYAQYATASIQDIFGSEIEKAKKYTASTLESVLIKDIMGISEVEKLPFQAQLSPVNTIVFYDINGDGYDDLIISGAIYQSRVRIGIMDGSDISVFLNNKQGAFTYLKELGIKGQVTSMTMFDKTLLAGVHNDWVRYLKFN